MMLMGIASLGQTSDTATSRGSANPTFDFSAMDAFWQIVKTLEEDRDPSPEQWDSLLSTPGYMALTASEFDPVFFVTCFTLAYKPSRNAELQVALKEPRKGRYLKHYLEVRSRRAALIEHEARLQNEAILTRAVEKARRFLPDELPPVYPPVAFVVFADDGRGYEPIVIDLLASLKRPFDSFLAHESHHWYRNRLLAFDPARLDVQDEHLVATLNQIQAEGIADQIDKARWFDPGFVVPEPSKAYADRYKEAHARTPGVISRLDSLLCAMSEAPPDARQPYGEEIAELIPMSGHPTGFFMASLIAEELGPERLVAEIGNPFAFCRSYDQAARRPKADAAGFSTKALHFLSQLETRYVGKSAP
jgi:hypothetical protein